MKQAIFLLLVLFSTDAFSQWGGEDHRIQDELIVMLRSDTEVKELLHEVPELKLIKNISKQMNIWLMKTESNSAEAVLSALQLNRKVKLAQFNHKVEQRSLVPNDSFFNLQWNMQNTGLNGGTFGADIHATEAWMLNHNNITVNGDTIVVAVIDGTFDLNHEDLNFFKNYQEVPNNGIDDDANGFIDDYEGWNAYDNSGKINKGGTDPHSMHIAGIVGAIGNDSIGVAGTCWGVKILRVAGSSTTEADAVAAYDYVIAMRNLYNQTAGAKGAFIVATNSSFGVDNGSPLDFPIWCALYDTMGSLGILSATATANRPQDVDIVHDIPTECPSKWMIAVTNTTATDNLNPGSAYGKVSIDMGAPGTSIYSTYAANGYGYRTGTSMASPHIAGGIAAMYAAACPRLIDDYLTYPDSIALIVKQMMLKGADRLSDLFNKTSTGGRLNLYQAVRNLDEYNCSDCNYLIAKTIQQPSCNNSCDGSISLTVTGSSNYTYDWGTGFGNFNSKQNLCPGFYSVTVKDDSGCLQTQNVSLFMPDSIAITSITTVPVNGSNPGNIIITATAGNYQLEYSLNAVDYQPTATFSIPVSGSYTVYVRSESGCIVQKTVVVNSSNEIEELNDWNVYPNPAQDILNVSLSLSKNTGIIFSVLNLLGETVLEERKAILSGIHIATIDLSAFQSGVFFLQIKTNGSYVTKKFIVQK